MPTTSPPFSALAAASSSSSSVTGTIEVADPPSSSSPPTPSTTAVVPPDVVTTTSSSTASSSSCSSSRVTAAAKLKLSLTPPPEKLGGAASSSSPAPQLIFLDLDNTLIPTNWIMEQWRSSPQKTLRRKDEINSELEETGLFRSLDSFFEALTEACSSHQRIVIVTNAAVKTVECFYLGFMIPQLAQLLCKYRILIRSTEGWIDVCGPAPPQTEDKEFREYYTRKKYLQFRKELLAFSDYLASISSGDDPRHSPIDVISIGDQFCEITAAIRLCKTNTPIGVRQTRLLLILDAETCPGLTCPKHFAPVSPSPDRFNFRSMLPQRLSKVLDIVLHMASMDSYTVVRKCCLQKTLAQDGSILVRYDPAQLEVVVPSGEVCTLPYAAAWIPRARDLAYCIGHPSQFSASDMCPALPLDVGCFGEDLLNGVDEEDDDCWPHSRGSTPSSSVSSEDSIMFLTQIAHDAATAAWNDDEAEAEAAAESQGRH